MNNRHIRIGTRDSKLAMIQAQMVADCIARQNPSFTVELVPMKTSGDILLGRSLDSVGGKGLFVKELDSALLEGRVDITVHSYKDMPMETSDDLPIVALSPREDPRDVMILPVGQAEETKPYGCSSLRRKIQIESLLGVKTMPIRGNVLTRLEKLDRHEYAALVLAAAGILRLGLRERISRIFTVDEILPAACQGIIAVQSRKGEDVDFLGAFHSAESEYASKAERAFVGTLDGGCSSPVAAYAQVKGGELMIKGLYVDDNREIVRKGMLGGSTTEAEKLGAKLAVMLKSGQGCATEEL